MSTTKAHVLTDGTTIKVRTDRTIAGTYYTELPSRKRKGATFMLLVHSMFLLHGEMIIPIRHPDYEYAANDKDGAVKALAFCVESAEACITESLREGYPIEDNYAKPGEV